MSERRSSGGQRHGNIFSRDSGTMLIHVQRQNGLAHRTLVLQPWQVQVLRVVTSRWAIGLFAIGLLSWTYFAVQAARVPLLTTRLAHMEEDARRIDTLQQTLATLQSRYDQVQKMMSTTSPTAAGRAAAADASPSAVKSKVPAKSASKSGDSARVVRPDSLKKPQP